MAKQLTCVESIWKRDKWTTERDTERGSPKKKVPKGAVKSLSMGDKIAEFHKQQAKSLKDGLAAAKSLETAITTYKKGIKDSYKEFHDRIEKSLESWVKQYIKEAEELLQGATKYPGAWTDVKNEIVNVHNELKTWQQEGSVGDFKPRSGKALADKLNAFANQCGAAMYVSDKVKEKDHDELLVLNKQVASGASWKSALSPLAELIQKLPARL